MTERFVSAPLLYFLKIAETGSFTSAARALRVSQPSLSVAIKKLEEDLGTTLLLRTRQGVSLTRSGEVLMHHATHARRTLQTATEEIHGLEAEPRGQLTIGCHESLGAYLLPGFMGKFLGAHPKIRVSLWNGNSREVQRAVVDRQVDVGLVVNPQEHPDCVVVPLFGDRVELVVSTALYTRVGADVATLLSDYPVLHVPVLAQVQYILGALALSGRRIERQIPCSSMELVKSLVLDGVGVGILPFRVASYGSGAGKLVPLDGEQPRFDDTIALVRRFDMHMTHAARLLLDALRDHGKAMPPLPGAAPAKGGARTKRRDR
ncbi:MAG: LysR family transcriptional regulator [Deltaproteobacteria bacterium]|nr:LysR family transcriptional regulator [Deltaproteobacteria bacterium]